MRRPGRTLLRILMLALLLAGAAAAFWFGLVPQRYSPFAPISLSERPEWFIDFRLAALHRDPALCRAVLSPPHIVASPIPDNPIGTNGCGWINAVRISDVAGAQLSAAELTCEDAAALALWIEYEVQPLAIATFGSRIAALHSLGTYSCRNIIGNHKWAQMRSQHALANAIDISSFKLANGQEISVKRNWKGNERGAHFLHEAHARACRYFRVAIGPDFNAAHEDHFHLDRGIFRTCR
jgi:hypothetical protein